jgi:hypothetical protein
MTTLLVAKPRLFRLMHAAGVGIAANQKRLVAIMPACARQNLVALSLIMTASTTFQARAAGDGTRNKHRVQSDLHWRKILTSYVTIYTGTFLPGDLGPRGIDPPMKKRLEKAKK